MKVSIVIPSYQQAAFLEQCLQSVMNQQGVTAEILVYDGGSTDGSLEVIKRYADRITYWQSTPDGGQAAALRTGFDRATGDLLGWLNSDDLLLPGALAAAVSHAQDHPEQPVFYGDALWIDAQNQLIRPKREIDFDWSIFAYGYCYLPQPATFFRHDAYDATGGLDPTLNCCMDYDLWHKLTRMGPCGHQPTLWACMREHPATKTSRLAIEFRREEKLLHDRYLQCSRSTYAVRHFWHRVRRVWLRWRTDCYQPLTEEELQRCQPIIH